MNKITLHRTSFTRNLILILVLAMLTSSLCGCSMIFGEEAPEDKERTTYTEQGLSFEIPKDYARGNILLSNGEKAPAWANDLDDVEFYFSLRTISANEIDVETFNWFATGYFSGQITYMGETLTLSPAFINPSINEREEITLNGNKGFRTRIVYDYKESEDKITNTTEVVYIVQYDDIIAYMVFSVRTADYSEYSELIKIIAESMKKA